MTDICKGQTVQEDKTFRLNYFQHHLVSFGKPKDISLKVYACADPDNDGPPMYKNSRKPVLHVLIVSLTYRKGNVIKLVLLTADLSIVPAERFPRKHNRKGVPYYLVKFQIEVTYFSAYTKYELIHDDINYGAVSAEYV